MNWNVFGWCKFRLKIGYIWSLTFIICVLVVIVLDEKLHVLRNVHVICHSVIVLCLFYLWKLVCDVNLAS